MLLTVSQEVEQHFNLRQRVQAGEVCSVRATRSGRLLPAPCFCFWQHPIAETTVRPPAISTLRVDILPVLCKSKNNQEMRGKETRTAQTRLTRFYNTNSQQTLFWSSRQQCNEKEGQTFTPQVQCRCWGQELQELKKLLDFILCLIIHPCHSIGHLFISREAVCMLMHCVCLSHVCTHTLT